MKATAIEEIKIQLSALSPQERAEVAHFLLATLEPEPTQSAEDFDTMLLRRLEEIKSGKVKGIPWEDVLAELEALDKG